MGERDGVQGAAFFKMTGSGNDFVFLDGRVHQLEDWPRERIAAVCDRRNGAGGDGLVLLVPDAPGRVRMHYFNADGGRADMCGNAALCSTRLSARLGMTRPEQMELATDAGVLQTRCVGPGEMAEIRLTDGARPVTPAGLTLEPGERWMALATVGVPHLVIRVDDIEQVDLDRRGRALRWHAALAPAGANANFISAPLAAGGPWLIRTFERGVEGETLACGTGTVAAALALAGHAEANLPVPFLSRGGAPLSVSATLDSDGAAHDTWLCGQGRLVFEGVYLAG
jgi:diaminopimelate epimerase